MRYWEIRAVQNYGTGRVTTTFGVEAADRETAAEIAQQRMFPNGVGATLQVDEVPAPEERVS